jgi:hypothetical protein
LFETARQLYGWTAVQHMQRHLGAAVRSGQLQHWRETDRAAVVKTLRDAAGEAPTPDLEVETMRGVLAGFHAELAEAMGWLSYDVSTLVRETAAEVARLRAANERLQRQLDEERKARRS